MEDKPRSGRPRKLTKSDEKYLKVTSLRDRKKTSRALTAQLVQTSGTQVHSSTIRRTLIRNGHHGRVAVRKPLLRKGNKTKRLKYVREHNNWNFDQWKKVLWSDESKFEIFGSKRRQYVRRRSGEELQEPCLQPTVKHGGGSIQVWGCISAGGVGDLVRIDGIMNAEKYRQIFIHHAIQSGRRLIGPRFTFQQDNDPKHTANKFKRYLKRKEDQRVLELMEWPPHSRDLNIFEAIWDHLDRKKIKKQPKSQEELWEVLQNARNNISEKVLQKLQESISKIIQQF